MGDSTNQFPILNDGTAAHALDNAASTVQELRVRDLQQEIPAVGSGFRINLQNFRRIFPGLGAIYLTADLSRTRENIIVVCCWDGFPRPAVIGGTKNTLWRIAQQTAKAVGTFRAAL